VIVALAAALGAAVGYGISTVLQAVGTRRARGLAVARQPLVVAGLVMDGAAWLLSLAALDRLPLFVVQTTLASSLVVVVLLAARVLDARLRPRDTAAVGAVVAALVILAAGAGDQPASPPPPGFTPAVLVAGGVLALGVVAAYRAGPPALLAGLGGLGYSGAAVAARGSHASGGLLDAVLQPSAAAVVVCGVVGTVAYLRALERGTVGAVAAVEAVVEVVVPGVVGVALLGDTVRAGWSVPVLAAAVVAGVGCVVLATSPANAATEDAAAAA
jgi:drug/metabolite transporter (DMT)-like permease